MSSQRVRHKPLWVWFLWLGLFYASWLLLIQLDGAWQHARDNWPIALAMALGSYAAGSTPMGGGTIGFPVLVLFFDMPASLGRDFSFAVQSIGMVSASIFILVRRQPIAWALLKGALLGAFIGTPVGILLFAPLISELVIKLAFAVLWCSFGVLQLWRMHEFAGHVGMTEFDERWDYRVGLLIGLVASTFVVSVTGVGIDMLVYAALVLLCRADLKIAVPTSIILMAFSSVCGVAVKSLTDGWQPGVYEHWLAAAPVVAIGAPLGVWVVEAIGRKPTLLFVALLCIGQFVWTCLAEYQALGLWGISAGLAAVGVWLLLFERLRVYGLSLVHSASRRDNAHTGARLHTDPPA